MATETRVVLDLTTRVKVIHASKRDKFSVKQIMKMFNVGKTQVYEILKNSHNANWTVGKSSTQNSNTSSGLTIKSTVKESANKQFLQMRLERTTFYYSKDTNKQSQQSKFINQDFNSVPHIRLLKANPYGPMQFSYGGQPPIPTSKSSSAFNPRFPNPFWEHLST
jgi:hypothetical protein